LEAPDELAAPIASGDNQRNADVFAVVTEGIALLPEVVIGAEVFPGRPTSSTGIR